MPLERHPTKTFRDLVVWRKAHEFVLAIYNTTLPPPSRSASGLRIHRGLDQLVGGSQSSAQRLCWGHSDFWLLTSGFHIPKDIKGGALG